MDTLIILMIVFGLINLVAIALFGIVPPFLIGWIMLKKSQKLVEEARSIADGVPGLFRGGGEKLVNQTIEYLGSQKFTDHLLNVFNGSVGAKVKELKGHLTEEHSLAGLPAPVASVVGKGISGYLKDAFNIPRKTTEGAVQSLFQKKDPAGNQAKVQKALQDIGSDYQISPYEP